MRPAEAQGQGSNPGRCPRVSQTWGGASSKKMRVCRPPRGPTRTSAGGYCTRSIVSWKKNQNSVGRHVPDGDRADGGAGVAAGHRAVLTELEQVTAAVQPPDVVDGGIVAAVPLGRRPGQVPQPRAGIRVEHPDVLAVGDREHRAAGRPGDRGGLVRLAGDGARALAGERIEDRDVGAVRTRDTVVSRLPGDRT